jgi:DNA-binding NtrC family response regulator
LTLMGGLSSSCGTAVDGNHLVVEDSNASEAEGLGRARLFVLGDRGFSTHVLPVAGKITLGSGSHAQVRIEDPSVLAAHAEVAIGPPLSISALDPKGRVRVGGVDVAAGDALQISGGDVITIGNITVMVEGRVFDAPKVRSIPGHGYFELRLEEECQRAARYRSTFAILSIVCRDGPTPTIEELLVKTVRRVEPLAVYAPGEYEVLLTLAKRADAELVSSRLVDRFRTRGLRVEIGLACYPEDGQHAERLLESSRVRARGGVREAPSVASSPHPHSGPLGQVYAMARRVARSDIAVMLLGETGVGKELLAGMIQRESLRCGKPYLCINCATLSEQLFESELFGHERGAFTGATAAKAGLLETANEGTVLLDEIGDMPVASQGKLLRVIEERAVRRVGGLRSLPLDVRFISATHRNLEHEVARGNFRADLYYRLNGIHLVVPPLRERVTEIPSLARLFVAEAAGRNGVQSPPPLSEEALAVLVDYHWPGNVRELRNVIERAVLLCGNEPIGPDHLPTEKLKARVAELPNIVPPMTPAGPRRPSLEALPSIASSPPEPVLAASPMRSGAAVAPLASPPTPSTAAPLAAGSPSELRSGIASYERERIMAALAECAGNQSEAARRLGIPRRTLVKRLGEYQVPRPRKRRAPSPSK